MPLQLTAAHGNAQDEGQYDMPLTQECRNERGQPIYSFAASLFLGQPGAALACSRAVCANFSPFLVLLALTQS